ncbi:hypothetical protein Q0590_33950 [Rhodocytophaga aerolata]|uniref:Uncharacterized protein n=1 Tax=Rhodocytophaga aerolata TaxID=455078 RepID=A0ABT8RJC4_9BACT|nr:hypothetical protein [Rhodocytophaga aerolata]MDO1451328.1 hypothetical protein [Rhodocytophaga aerolata]
MNRIYCFKWHQQEGMYLYCKLYANRQPPAQETINLSHPQPIIDFHEFDLTHIKSQLLLSELFESTTLIECWEYQAAYKQVTSQVFDLYINGEKQTFDF